MANRLATTSDVATYPNYPMQEGDLILDSPNTGYGGFFFSAGSGKIDGTSEGLGFVKLTEFSFANRNIWIIGGTYGPTAFRDACIQGASPYSTKIRNFNGRGKFDVSLSSGILYGMQFQGCRNFEVNGFADPNFQGHRARNAFKKGSYGFWVQNNWVNEGVFFNVEKPGATGYRFIGCEASDGGFSGFAFHEPNDETSDVYGAQIKECYIHDTKGEGFYIGSNKDAFSQNNDQQMFFNLLLQDIVIARSGVENFQIGQLSTGTLAENITSYLAALRWKSSFQKFQEGNAQIGYRTGGIIIRNSVFDGFGEQGYFITKRRWKSSETDPANANDRIESINNYIGGGRAYNSFISGIDDQTTPIIFDGCYFGDIVFQHDEAYIDTDKNATVITRHKNPQTFQNCHYDNNGGRVFVLNESGQTGHITETNNTGETVEKPVYERDGFKEICDRHSLPHDRRLLEEWTHVVGAEPAFGSYETYKGDPVYYNVNDFVMFESRLYRCLQYHTASNQNATPPAISTYDSNKRPDNDVGANPSPDVNGETLGTYWALQWFDNSGNWVDYFPDDLRVKSGTLYASMGVRNLLSLPDNEPPTDPTNLREVSKTATSITIAWDPSDDPAGVAGYKLHINGTYLNGQDVATNQKQFTGLVSGTQYTLGVQAYDNNGNEGNIVTIQLTTATPGTSLPGKTGNGLMISI